MEQLTEPDIVLNIGKFVPNNRHCYVVNDKYYIKDNYVYCQDSGKRTQWEIEINGLEQETMTVKLYLTQPLQVNPFRRMYTQHFLPQTLLQQIIDVKLAAKGCFLMHTAAIAKDSQVYLFSGRAGCFSTTLGMEFVRRDKFTWLGDDHIILQGNKALGFPLSPAMFYFMNKYLADETRWNRLRKFQFMSEYLLGKLNRFSITPVASGRLAGILQLAKDSNLSGTRKIYCMPVPESQVQEVRDILMFNREIESLSNLGVFGLNFAYFMRCFLAYSFVFPGNTLVLQQQSLKNSLLNSLDGVPIYKVSIPPVYGIEIYEGLRRLIREISK